MSRAVRRRFVRRLVEGQPAYRRIPSVKVTIRDHQSDQRASLVITFSPHDPYPRRQLMVCDQLVMTPGGVERRAVALEVQVSVA